MLPPGPVSLVEAGPLAAVDALAEDVTTALTHVRRRVATYNDALEKPQFRKYFITPDVNFPDKSDVL